MPQAMSARDQIYSRQEDLDTVYMQSTMHYNKDLMHGNQARLGNTSKSPDLLALSPESRKEPLMAAGYNHSIESKSPLNRIEETFIDYAAEKSVATQKSDRNRSNTVRVTGNTDKISQEKNVSTERRQI